MGRRKKRGWSENKKLRKKKRKSVQKEKERLERRGEKREGSLYSQPTLASACPSSISSFPNRSANTKDSTDRSRSPLLLADRTSCLPPFFKKQNLAPLLRQQPLRRREEDLETSETETPSTSISPHNGSTWQPFPICHRCQSLFHQLPINLKCILLII